VLRPHLNERQWRLLLGAEAEALGRGGIALVARVSGASRTTVQAGVTGVVVGKTTVARLLKQAGYRSQATFKTKEGAPHPDRDAQCQEPGKVQVHQIRKLA
jgi:hypothetical protein